MHRNHFKELMITGLSRDVNVSETGMQTARCKEKCSCSDKSMFLKQTGQVA
jgi:hypothetical protein